MFCPECGTLYFMVGNGNIRCTNYTCEYEGPLAGKDGKGADFTDPMTGETIDLSKVSSTSSEAPTMKHLNEVIPENVFDEETRKWIPIKPEQAAELERIRELVVNPPGELWEEWYTCPKCDCKKIHVWMQQTRSSDEPETIMCKCSECGHHFAP